MNIHHLYAKWHRQIQYVMYLAGNQQSFPDILCCPHLPYEPFSPPTEHACWSLYSLLFVYAIRVLHGPNSVSWIASNYNQGFLNWNGLSSIIRPAVHTFHDCGRIHSQKQYQTCNSCLRCQTGCSSQHNVPAWRSSGTVCIVLPDALKASDCSQSYQTAATTSTGVPTSLIADRTRKKIKEPRSANSRLKH